MLESFPWPLPASAQAVAAATVSALVIGAHGISTPIIAFVPGDDGSLLRLCGSAASVEFHCDSRDARYPPNDGACPSWTLNSAEGPSTFYAFSPANKAWLGSAPERPFSASPLTFSTGLTALALVRIGADADLTTDERVFEIRASGSPGGPSVADTPANSFAIYMSAETLGCSYWDTNGQQPYVRASEDVSGHVGFWLLIACVFNGGTNHKLYTQRLDRALEFKVFNTASALYPVADFSGADTLWIGRGSTSAAAADHTWTGDIAAVSVYNTAMSQADVKDWMTAASSGGAFSNMCGGATARLATTTPRSTELYPQWQEAGCGPLEMTTGSFICSEGDTRLIAAALAGATTPTACYARVANLDPDMYTAAGMFSTTYDLNFNPVHSCMACRGVATTDTFQERVVANQVSTIFNVAGIGQRCTPVSAIGVSAWPSLPPFNVGCGTLGMSATAPGSQGSSYTCDIAQEVAGYLATADPEGCYNALAATQSFLSGVHSMERVRDAWGAYEWVYRCYGCSEAEADGRQTFTAVLQADAVTTLINIATSVGGCAQGCSPDTTPPSVTCGTGESFVQLTLTDSCAATVAWAKAELLPALSVKDACGTLTASDVRIYDLDQLDDAAGPRLLSSTDTIQAHRDATGRYRWKVTVTDASGNSASCNALSVSVSRSLAPKLGLASSASAMRVDLGAVQGCVMAPGQIAAAVRSHLGIDEALTAPGHAVGAQDAAFLEAVLGSGAATPSASATSSPDLSPGVSIDNVCAFKEVGAPASIGDITLLWFSLEVLQWTPDAPSGAMAQSYGTTMTDSISLRSDAYTWTGTGAVATAYAAVRVTVSLRGPDTNGVVTSAPVYIEVTLADDTFFGLGTSPAALPFAHTTVLTPVDGSDRVIELVPRGLPEGGVTPSDECGPVTCYFSESGAGPIISYTSGSAGGGAPGKDAIGDGLASITKGRETWQSSPGSRTQNLQVALKAEASEDGENRLYAVQRVACMDNSGNTYQVPPLVITVPGSALVVSGVFKQNALLGGLIGGIGAPVLMLLAFFVIRMRNSSRGLSAHASEGSWASERSSERDAGSEGVGSGNGSARPSAANSVNFFSNPSRLCTEASEVYRGAGKSVTLLEQQSRDGADRV